MPKPVPNDNLTSALVAPVVAAVANATAASETVTAVSLGTDSRSAALPHDEHAASGPGWAGTAWSAVEFGILVAVAYFFVRLWMRGELRRTVTRWKDLAVAATAWRSLRSRRRSGSTTTTSSSSSISDFADASTVELAPMASSGGGGPMLLGLAPGEASLLAPADIAALLSHLPSRCHGKDWRLLYSTSQHGYSLPTLLNRARGNGPTLLLCLTSDGHVVGGFASRDWSGNDYLGSTIQYSFPSLMAASRASSSGGKVDTSRFFGSEWSGREPPLATGSPSSLSSSP